MITNINISRLLPHPNNPRKDLGDLTELADSIKSSGILQNLTIVPVDADDYVKMISSKRKYKGDFTIVIGHRRHAAAKLAGLAEVPCIISDMGEKKQLATMLLENIQRNDLSNLEQAQGFRQLTLAGIGEDEIVKMTGFSKSKIKNRLRLLELDSEKLQQAESRGGKLQDYDELFKIKDKKRRDKVLETIGTNNFNFELTSAIQSEKTAANKKALIEVLDSFAEKVTDTSKLKYDSYLGFNSTENYKKPKDADKVKYYYKTDSGGLNLYREKDVTTPTDTKDKEVEKEEQKALDERREKLKESSLTAFRLRFEFVRNFVPKKEHFADLMRFAALTIYNDEYLDDNITESLWNYSEDDESDVSFEDYFLETLPKIKPEVALLRMIYSVSDGENYSYRNNDCTHSINDDLNRLYTLLGKFGYQMSDEEKALQDGTHELYVAKSKE